MSQGAFIEMITRPDIGTTIFASTIAIFFAACSFYLFLALRRMTHLREDERKGRTTAEKALRAGRTEQVLREGWNFRMIGTVETPFRDRRGTPRQGTVAPASEAVCVFDPKICPPASLEELEKFSHCWVIFVFHENTIGSRSSAEKQTRKGKGSTKEATFTAKITPPRLGRKVGVFSTRSPHRPNPIGLSVCRILNVDIAGLRIQIGGADLVDGTPLLDIKPYTPYDCVPDCSVPQWVLPPDESDLTSGLRVAFTEAALKDIEHIFSDSHALASCLKHYQGRQDKWKQCVGEVISQDPRSLLSKKNDSQKPYRLVIDGLEVNFVASTHVQRQEEGREMLVQEVCVVNST